VSFASYRAACLACFSGPARADGHPDPLAHGATLGAWSVWECSDDGADRCIGLFVSEEVAIAVCTEFNLADRLDLDYRVSREYVWGA